MQRSHITTIATMGISSDAYYPSVMILKKDSPERASPFPFIDNQFFLDYSSTAA